MNRVRLEALPWVSDAFAGQRSGPVILEKEVEQGTTMGDLLQKLAQEYQAFGDIMFDAGTSNPSGSITIVLNDRLVESLNGLDTAIQDGDSIKLFPVIAGG